jgi:protein SCO1/2
MVRSLRLRAILLTAAVLLPLAAHPAEPEPSFTLRDGEGRPVDSAAFRGSFLLVYFGYTHCVDLCPTGLSTMAAALDQLGAAASHVQPLFITIDPERDHGPGLGAFTRAFDDRLVGLTGTPDEIAAIARRFGVRYDKIVLAGDDYVIDHSADLYLLDPQGRFVEKLKMSEPYQIAAELFAQLGSAGVSLVGVNNLGAYR